MAPIGVLHTSIHHVIEIHPHDHGDDAPVQLSNNGPFRFSVDKFGVGANGLVLEALDLAGGAIRVLETSREIHLTGGLFLDVIVVRHFEGLT